MSDERTAQPDAAFHPRYVVWELTLACDLACRHCGSRAGKARPDELSREEALALVDRLAEMGTREITFIGGEAYLVPWWHDVVAAATARGIQCALTTGGRDFHPERAVDARAAGLRAVSVSIDGLETTHDTLRAVPGSFKAAFRALAGAKSAGLVAFANTQFNQLNLPELETLAGLLEAAGISSWQVQITGPMGRAADKPDWLLQPYQMLELIPRLAAVAARWKPKGIRIFSSNNLGYYGPYEQHLRQEHWKGCVAGKYVMGIESNGDIKGCPSLPSEPYVGGNIRENDIGSIWADAPALNFARDRLTTPQELGGYCKRCYYGPVCQGGCSWTSHTALGRRGDMPWCYHRADMLRQEGVRERIQRVENAPGAPFDFGRYEIVVEEWKADS